MSSAQEKVEFAKRLRFVLTRRELSIKGPTQLANQFNLRYAGRGVSPQTTHKWLTGRAIPNLDKLATLAAWLEVSKHWLHYGPPPAEEPPAWNFCQGNKVGGPPSEEMLSLAAKIQALPAHQRYLMEELVAQLGKSEELGEVR